MSERTRISGTSRKCGTDSRTRRWRPIAARTSSVAAVNAAAGRRYEEVVERAELVERQPVPDPPVVAAHHAHEALEIERPRADVRRREPGAEDAEVDLRRLELAADGAEIHRAHGEAGERRRRLEPVDELRQDRVLHVVGRRDGEGHLRSRRVERPRLLDQPVDVGDQLLHRRGELEPLGRGQHPAGGAQQQRIAEERAQPAERRAHRRLRKVQPARRARDVALAQQRVERDQEVEVDRADIHGTDESDRKDRFEGYRAAHYLPIVGCAPRRHTLSGDMDMRFDHLLGAVGYAALAIAALGAAWLLADALGGGVAGAFPAAPVRLFG